MSDRTTHPDVWPRCMTVDSKTGRTCHSVHVLRRVMTFSDTEMASKWLWMPDCKHKPGSKNVVVEIHDENGKVGE